MNNNPKYTQTPFVNKLISPNNVNNKNFFYKYFTDNNGEDYTKEQLDKDFNDTWDNSDEYPLVSNLDVPVLQYYLTVLEYKIWPYFPKYKFNMKSFISDFEHALKENTFEASKFSNHFDNPPPASAYAKGLINTLLLKVVYEQALPCFAELQTKLQQENQDVSNDL
ncbi:MAG: hypothetical protein MJ149_00165 [Clostridia bacterium]|nr:hypothetical protein [Clostridia bacterium]